MSQPGHPPRDYQIAELTRGVECPLPALKPRHLKIIAEFLVQAWQGLLETQEQVIRTKEEVEINGLMDLDYSAFLTRVENGQRWCPPWLGAKNLSALMEAAWRNVLTYPFFLPEDHAFPSLSNAN